MIKKLIFIAIMLTGMLAAVQAQPGKGQMKAADTNGDGQISAEEFAASAQQRFAKMDANGDGVLTQDEMRRGRRGKDRMGMRSGPRHNRIFFRVADSNQDRTISADEWAAFLGNVTADDGETIDFEKVMAAAPEDCQFRQPANPPTLTVAQAQLMFEKMDLNGDGAITEDEHPRQRMRQRMHGAMGAKLIFHGAETDGVPGISADEWSAFTSALDPDGDGNFTATQLAELIHTNRDMAPPEGRTPRIINQLDTDGDGNPDVAGLQQAFDKLDANGDGAITEDELPRGPRHQRRGRR